MISNSTLRENVLHWLHGAGCSTSNIPSAIGPQGICTGPSRSAGSRESGLAHENGQFSRYIAGGSSRSGSLFASEYDQPFESGRHTSVVADVGR